MSFSLSDTLSDMTKTAAALEKEPAAAAAGQQQALLQQQVSQSVRPSSQAVKSSQSALPFPHPDQRTIHRRTD